MIDKIKVICIKIGNFKHHGKLEVGKIYLSKDVGNATLWKKTELRNSKLNKILE